MLRIDCLLAGIAGVCVAVALSGCANSEDPSTPSAATSAHDHDHSGDDHDAGHDHDAAEGHAGHDDDAQPSEHAEQLAKLSEADRAIAEKQKICPVSGEPLGSMGVPVKVTVKDRGVLLCCEGCRTAILDDPDTYLAKLDAE